MRSPLNQAGMAAKELLFGVVLLLVLLLIIREDLGASYEKETHPSAGVTLPPDAVRAIVAP